VSGPDDETRSRPVVAHQPDAARVPRSAWRADLRHWFRPPQSPPPQSFVTRSEEVAARLGAPGDSAAAELLAEAERAYGDAAERADGAERRANTIQGAIAIATSLALAGGSLLLDDQKVSGTGWRWLIACTYALIVAIFAVAAWRAFLVTWPRYMWASPYYEDVYEHAGEDGARIKVLRAADLFVAYGRNDSIAMWKIKLLGSAVRWLLAGLVLVALLAAMVAANAISRETRRDAAPKAAPASPQHARPKPIR
jgi:hypothetical protein